ncbi:serine/threonine-protein kinase [Streptomyces sp. NPDC051211]|uniref:serine/threonine-protein kinase n=1 Tax=Streptomyces sp. NPDC051211 TaxID=3154643 RepID=UPI00344EA751
MARLGAGGMGRVYLGRSASGRAVAVKVVRAELAEDAGFRQRFAREVEAARRVTGFFTAAVVDADPEGSPAWLATAYVPGLSLEGAVRAHGAWRDHSVLALGAGLAEALEAIHSAGVIHRDLKPSNVLLAPDGPRVIDFGISVAAEASALTQTGTVIGTPGFMSPEQVTGKPVGPPSDVFSLGAVLTYAATGASPFGTGSGHAVNFRTVYEKPFFGGLQTELLDLIVRCMAKNPHQRPAVAEVLEECARALGKTSGQWITTQVLARPGWLPEAVAQTFPLDAALLNTEEYGQEGLPSIRVSHAGPSNPNSQVGPNRENGDVLPERPGEQAPAAPLAARLVRLLPRISRRRLMAGFGTAIVTVLALATWRFFDDGRSARWSFATDGVVNSSPTVADGTVYVGSDSDSETGSNLYAVDMNTGKQRWVLNVHGDTVSSPTTAGGLVYVINSDGNLRAVERATGKQQWLYQVPGFSFDTVDSSPTVADGTVYVGDGLHTLHAVDASTGEKRWTFDAGSQVRSAPALVDGTVYFSAGSELNALDAATGRKRWAFDGDGPMVSTPAVAGGTAYDVIEDGSLYAVDIKTGRERWNMYIGGPTYSSPKLADGTVYVGSGDGVLYAADVKTGKERWALHVEGAVNSSPVVADGTVYVGSADSNLYAVDAATGEKRWTLDTDGEVNSSPVVAGGTVYVGSKDGKLYAVKAKD